MKTIIISLVTIAILLSSIVTVSAGGDKVRHEHKGDKQSYGAEEQIMHRLNK